LTSESLRPTLSAIVLCYRAGATIVRVLEPLYDLLEREGIDFELVCVANYWPQIPDDTPALVQQFGQARQLVTVVADEKHGAMGWDMRAGLSAARGEHLVVIDGDAQNPVEDVLRMYRRLIESGADVGKGRRTNRADGLYRRVISWGFNLSFRVLFGTAELRDINGKPKGLTRSAYEQMHLRSDDWFIDAEIVLEARRHGMRMVEIPVVFLENPERSSFVRFRSVWEFARHMVRYRVTGGV
jgi:glycosyltransferase involved in cell wall biosynthesis